jgi:hypothetical protein
MTSFQAIELLPEYGVEPFARLRFRRTHNPSPLGASESERKSRYLRSATGTLQGGPHPLVPVRHPCAARLQFGHGCRHSGTAHGGVACANRFSGTSFSTVTGS